MSGRTYTIVSAMDDTGTLTVRSDTGATYDVAAFATDGVRERCRTLSPGSRTRLELTSGPDGWTVTRPGPGTAPESFGAD